MLTTFEKFKAKESLDAIRAAELERLAAARSDTGQFSNNPFDHAADALFAHIAALKSGKPDDHEKAAALFSEASEKLHAAGHRRMAVLHVELADHHKAKMEACEARSGSRPANMTIDVSELDCAVLAANPARSLLQQNAVEAGYMMYMPEGIHEITPSCGGKPVTITVEIAEDSAEKLERQRALLSSGGHKPFFSILHESEISAFWPTRFSWDTRLDATGDLRTGVWADGEWSGAGSEAVNAKNIRTFSPTFWTDAKIVPENPRDPNSPLKAVYRDDSGVAHVVCNASARLNMGALENDPAFQEMPALWCRRSSELHGIVQGLAKEFGKQNTFLIRRELKAQHGIELSESALAGYLK